MLIEKEDLTVQELKGLLQFHLFQNLMYARQKENENPQQFLYHVISLKQNIQFASKHSTADIRYDAKTIQEVVGYQSESDNLRIDQMGVRTTKRANSTKRPRITRQRHKSVHDTLAP